MIVPDFKEKKKRGYRVSRAIGDKFKDTIKRKEEGLLEAELIAFEKKEEVSAP